MLQARPSLLVHDVQVFPDIQLRSAKVRLKIINLEGQERSGNVFLYAKSDNLKAFSLPVLWDPDTFLVPCYTHVVFYWCKPEWNFNIARLPIFGKACSEKE